MIEQFLSIIILSLIWIESFQEIEKGNKKYVNGFCLSFIRTYFLKGLLIGSCAILSVILLGAVDYFKDFTTTLLNASIKVFYKSLCYMFIIETITILTKN